MLEHVTHEITISALPTAIPESIPADVSGMVIGDTLQLSALDRPRGRRVRPRRGPERRRDHDRHALAAARRGGARARARGGGRAGRRGGRGAPRARRPRPRASGDRRRRLRRLRRGVAPAPVRRAARRGRARGDDRVLIVGLGNPGSRYARTRHNVGFEVAERARRSAGSCRSRSEQYRGLIAEGRIRPGRPARGPAQPADLHERVRRAPPARRAATLRVPLDQRDRRSTTRSTCRSARSATKLGGGVAGHNGLKSLARRASAANDFWRVRVGVGRPDSTDPEIVSAYVLGRFTEPDDEVSDADRARRRRDRAPGRPDRRRRGRSGE